MKTSWPLACVIFLTGCQGAPPCAVEPGFTNRFLVSRLILPTDRGQLAADLDGDGHADDQLGLVIQTMLVENLDPQSPVDAAFATGAQQLVLDVQSRDETQTSAAGAGLSIGEPGDGTPAELCGALAGGSFADQPSTVAPAAMMLKLAFLQNVEAPLTSVRVTFSRAPDGSIAGQINGALPAEKIAQVIWPPLAALLTKKIHDEPGTMFTQQLLEIFDTGGDSAQANPPCPNRACRDPFGPTAGQCAQANDGVISACEAGTEPIVRSILAPDVRLAGLDQPKDALSFGVGFVAQPEAD